jgi:amidohydrolase
VVIRAAGVLIWCGWVLSGQQFDERIRRETEAIQARLIETRRDLARHPELSNREVWTGKYIADRLRELGFTEVRANVARNGVVAVLRGGKPGPVVAWRADMDALPVQDSGDKPYKSQIEGVKHACGHDAHMAIALGVAEVLGKMKADLPGTVKFVFQPAEEGPPEGEEGGAPLMIKEGALENPKPSAIFGLHVWSQAPSGKIHYVSGGAMASADGFELKIQGKRVHAATPHLGIDPIVVAAQCVSAMQTIRSRRVDPLDPIVVTFGSIHGGNRGNIIPDAVTLQGTVRTLDEKTRESVRSMMRQTLDGCTSGSGASYEFKWSSTVYPVTFNDPELVRANLGGLQRAMGAGNVEPGRPTMGAEDFSFYTRVVPGFFWFLGIADAAKGTTGAHHTSEFAVDEDMLPLGVRAAAGQLVDYLSAGAKQAQR